MAHTFSPGGGVAWKAELAAVAAALAARAKNHGIYEASLVAVREEREGWCRVESATSADLWLPCEQLGRINAAAP